MTNIIAHRGASARMRENTVAAFELAVVLGADGVELQVQLDAPWLSGDDEVLRRPTGEMPAVVVPGSPSE